MQLLVSLIAALSVGTWVYTRMMRKSGNNTKNSLIVGAIVGAFAFIIIFTLAVKFLGK